MFHFFITILEVSSVFLGETIYIGTVLLTGRKPDPYLERGFGIDI